MKFIVNRTSSLNHLNRKKPCEEAYQAAVSWNNKDYAKEVDGEIEIYDDYRE